MAPQNQDDTDTDWDSAYDEEPEEYDRYESARNTHTQRSQRSSSAKAREASNEPTTPSNPARTQNTPPLPRDSIRAAYDEVSPLLESDPPPPAYADATAGRPYTGVLASSSADGNTDTDTHPANSRSRSSGPSQGYGSISTQPSGPQSERQPESTGGSNGYTGTNDLESGRRVSILKVKRNGKSSGHHKLRILFRGALLVTLISIIALVASATFSDSDSSDNESGDGRKPSPLIPPNSTFPDTHHSFDCPFEYYSDSSFYEFDSPQSFTFVELLEEWSHLSGGIGGLVRVTTPLEGQTAAIVVGVGIATTAPWYVSQIKVKQEAESLYLKAPTLLKKSGRTTEKPCMGIYATIFIRADITLTGFEISTENLDLRVEPGLFNARQAAEKGDLYISNTTDFTVLSGDVSVEHWSSRETRIDVTSGSVSGTYDLLDLLSVKTRSGSISINVEPKAADKTSPSPADFTATSKSGSINIHFPTSGHVEEIPEREYRTYVETNSGTISGCFIHGSSSTFRTSSGSIHVKALPYSPDAFASTFRTETHSGDIGVEILPSFTQPEIPITRMRSVHSTMSSSIHLVYPQQWEGVIEGESVSGSIALRGKNLVPIKHYKRPFGTHIEFRKGDGGSKIGLSTKSGSMDATIGDLF